MGLQELLDSTPARLAGRSSDLLQLVALAFTVLAALYGAGITWAAVHGASVPLVVGAAAVIATAAALAYYVMCIRTRQDFEIEELNGLLVVARVQGEGGRNHHRYTYNRQQRIRALRHDLRLVGIRSHWSGQSRTVEEVTSLFPEHRLLDGAIAEEDGRIHRWVYLLGPIARNRRVSVGIRHVFEDAYAPMKPYYRESGEERRVQKLSVRVRFACDDAPVEAWQVVWKRSKSGSTRQEVARNECRPIIEPDTGSVVYELLKSKPDPDCAYGISWRWPTTSSRSDARAPIHEEPAPMTRVGG
ncbi:hypothetical protein GKC29_02375 [Micromonospora sp. WMMC415]|uniref:hypothetical protein n=1 Tax=Micromonospora sp. WMMC415 TaxID=2675222 RepID=UPI0012B48091|nr:hypothetical protein [Micromonospora sp. WMMC415]QGN45812.1 hypothetical protein GKC29_02375 [Micromonospora sp. WMMC415]